MSVSFSRSISTTICSAQWESFSNQLQLNTGQDRLNEVLEVRVGILKTYIT